MIQNKYKMVYVQKLFKVHYFSFLYCKESKVWTVNIIYTAVLYKFKESTMNKVHCHLLGIWVTDYTTHGGPHFYFYNIQMCSMFSIVTHFLYGVFSKMTHTQKIWVILGKFICSNNLTHIVFWKNEIFYRRNILMQWV